MIYILGPMFGGGDPVIRAVIGSEIVKIQLIKNALDGRHPFFLGERRNVCYVKDVAEICRGLHLNAWGKVLPPVERPIGAYRAGSAFCAIQEVLDGNEHVMCLV